MLEKSLDLQSQNLRLLVLLDEILHMCRMHISIIIHELQYLILYMLQLI